MWYNVDFLKLTQLILPPRLRRYKIFAFLKAMILPLRRIYNEFVIYRKETLRMLDYSSHVIYLEKILNDEFILKLNEIFINDGNDLSEVYLFNKEESNPAIYLHNQSEDEEHTMLRNVGETLNEGPDFIVNVPLFLEPYEGRIRSIVNYYKIAGKQYNIKFYE